VNVVTNLEVTQNARNVACFLPGRAKDLSAPITYKCLRVYFVIMRYKI